MSYFCHLLLCCGCFNMKNKILITVGQRSAIHNLGIEALNDMQCSAIEHCRENGGMVLLSPTGTGKTLAYLLPLLERLQADREGVQAVVVLPSRELAKQVAEVWRNMLTPFRAVALYGGRPLLEEVAMLQGSVPAVLIATPGRLNDHLSRGNLNVEACNLLVIDEFDKCLELGFLEEMEHLVKMLPNSIDRWLISATDASEIPLFAGGDSVDKLDFRKGESEVTQRTAYRKLTTTPEARLQSLFSLLCTINGEPAIVFCNFRETVDEVRRFLSKNRLHVSAYHGAMEQKQRESALYRFDSGCANILVSTDLAARGLDIKDVKHVIHFQRPMTKEIYTHRNGRTARWEADGSVYMITYDGHTLPDFVPDDIEEFRMPKNVSLPDAPERVALYIGKGKKDKISRGDLVGFFIKKGGLQPDEVGAIAIFDRYAYIAVKSCKVRRLLAMVAGEKIKGLKTIIEPVRW